MLFRLQPSAGVGVSDLTGSRHTTFEGADVPDWPSCPYRPRGLRGGSLVPWPGPYEGYVCASDGPGDE
jgi:hypothetical protein